MNNLFERFNKYVESGIGYLVVATTVILLILDTPFNALGFLVLLATGMNLAVRYGKTYDHKRSEFVFVSNVILIGICLAILLYLLKHTL